MLRASSGSPCTLDRAFIDPATGNTTCVWSAPAASDMEAVFAKAGVTVESITEVEEMMAAADES